MDGSKYVYLLTQHAALYVRYEVDKTYLHLQYFLTKIDF